MFNFSSRTKLLISIFTLVSAISGTVVMAEMKLSGEKVSPTEVISSGDDESKDKSTGEVMSSESPQTIVDIASSKDSFETLTSALEAANLVDVLQGDGPFTVFAPTDDAFAALPAGTLEELLKPENKEILVKILTYHVVPEKVLSGDLQAGKVTTVEGSKVTIELGDEVTVDQAQIVEVDILASNGVIHVIDKVIIPAGLM